MESKPKRARKICPTCYEELSYRHFLRHIEDCKPSTSANDLDIFPDEITDKCETSLDIPSDHDSDSAIDYSNYKLDVRNRKTKNLEDEDVEAYFDDVVVNSDSDSESQEKFSDFDEYDDLFDTDISKSEHRIAERQIFRDIYWFCRLLMLWQCINYVSDIAVGLLLKLISSFLLIISFSSERCREFYNIFPKNLYSLTKFVKSEISFDQYVVCLKCYSLYNYDNCYVCIEGNNVPRTCTFVEFPNHRLPHFRRPCGKALLYEVHSISSKQMLYPFKTFCYKSVRSSLENLVQRSKFEDLCEKWRSFERKEGVLCDVFDGRIWKEFNGENYNFFTEEGNYGVMLNVDWFQPFKHTNCSIGVIYLAFFNLPREERFKRENIILVGVIPDMKTEPKTNTFMNLLVNELEEAWTNGFYMKSFKSKNTVKCFKLALLCVGCDVPASRKLCGFLGHSATMGCNKCKKEFPGMIGEKNYGGFDRSAFEYRTNSSHRDNVSQILNCSTKGERDFLERKLGTRYSCLIKLPYFDPIRMTPIDPMHNLFLGTAKHMINVWKKHDLLNDEKCKIIQDRIEPFHCPSDVGKLPQKFATSFGSFNADQLKNWTLLFSIYALKGILPDSHLECWRMFVLACRKMCSVLISRGNAKVADRLLMEFCQRFESLYGSEYVTPNMHLHCHLYDCILDFGPIYSFWLFSFERENGILGSYKTNKKNIEAQLMRRFLKESWAREKRDELNPNFESIFEDLSGTIRDRGTLGEISNVITPSVTELSSIYINIRDVDWTISCGIVSPSFKECVLNSDEERHLKTFYQNIFNHDQFVICSSVLKGKDICINGSVLGSSRSRTVRSSYVSAYWCDDDGKIDFDKSDWNPHPGQILEILRHCVIVDGNSLYHYLAKVNWFKRLPDNIRYSYGKPIEVWCSDIFVQDGPASFIPLHRIRSRFVFVKARQYNKNVIIVSPRERQIV